MAGQVFKYSHLSTKIRGMKGKMLSEFDYDQMVYKTDVLSVAKYLKYNTYYQKALEGVDEHDVHRGHLEILMYRAEIMDALKIAKHMKGNERKIYRYVYRKQEIEDLKKMLRTLQMGEPLESLDRKTLFISHYSKIDFNKALAAQNIRQLVDSIKETNFYPILNPLVMEDNRIDLFSAEMGLDMYYFNKVQEDMKNLTAGKDKDIITMFFGSEADIKNILWIYRGKKYYDIDKEYMYRYLISFHYKLHKEEIDNMIGAKSAEDVIGIVKKGYYRHIFSDADSDWEKEYMRSFLRFQLRNMRLIPFSIAPVIGYIYAKEVEIHNIITIIEGVRYKLKPEEIERQLVGYKV